MSPQPTEISNKVTVLVFKDNYAARTFQIPMKWITQFGVFLGILVGVASISSLLALKYYRIAIHLDPAHLQELEQEVTDLKINLKNLESRASDNSKPSVVDSAKGGTGDSNLGATDAKMNGSMQQTTVSSTTVLGPPIAAPLRVFPDTVQTQPPAANLSPINLQTPKITWKQNSLRVQFVLEYMKEDHGNQQGKVLILARGPNLIQTFPRNAMNRGTGSLLLPENGEFFSVSRFREVKARFSPVRSRDLIHEIEIWILDNRQQVLINQKFPIPKLADIQVPSEPQTQPSSLPEEGKTTR